MCLEPRPNGESDPCLLRVGRHFEVNWLFGDHPDDAEAVVYEIYERARDHRFAATHPVYVGIAASFPARWSSHRSGTWWFDRVNVLCVILHGYPSRVDARKVEAALIAEHRPAYNTKPERKYLEMGQYDPPSEYLFMAEVSPIGAFSGT